MQKTLNRWTLFTSNYAQFAPKFTLDILHECLAQNESIIISGETSTGIQELQKLLAFYPKSSNNRNIIAVIADSPALITKEYYPYESIMASQVNLKNDFASLLIDACRPNTDLIVTSKITDDAAETLLNAMSVGHKCITAIDAEDVFSIPQRMVQLVRLSSGDRAHNYSDAEIMAEVLERFELGCHLKTVIHNGQPYTYLHQIAYYSAEGSTLVFEQDIIDCKLHWQTFKLHDKLKNALAYPEDSTGIIRID